MSNPLPWLLQRRLGSGDSHKWRTVLRIPPAQVHVADEVVALAERIDPAVCWRLTDAQGMHAVART